MEFNVFCKSRLSTFGFFLRKIELSNMQAVTVDQAWTKAAAMLEKTLKKNEKRKNKTMANLFNAIK